MNDKPEKQYYTREELEEFRQIILAKLKEARKEYNALMDSLAVSTENSTRSLNLTEFGSEMSERRELEILSARLAKYINALERALIRIENGSYGICKVTGKLIPKERLRLVPHTELTIEAKKKQYNKLNTDD